jgi:hypothetical protein
MYLTTKNKEIEKIFNRLTRYPVLKVDPILAQAFSRHKKIRYLSRNGNIFIRKGVISIPDTGKLVKKNSKYFFKYR